ncbi:MAG: hypothetical protein JST22_03755 [Bacteroidetes bacterium]|nr:hypothetical protein [Bacteroidota bacterium]
MSTLFKIIAGWDHFVIYKARRFYAKVVEGGGRRRGWYREDGMIVATFCQIWSGLCLLDHVLLGGIVIRRFGWCLVVAAAAGSMLNHVRIGWPVTSRRVNRIREERVAYLLELFPWLRGQAGSLLAILYLLGWCAVGTLILVLCLPARR